MVTAVLVDEKADDRTFQPLMIAGLVLLGLLVVWPVLVFCAHLKEESDREEAEELAKLQASIAGQERESGLLMAHRDDEERERERSARAISSPRISSQPPHVSDERSINMLAADDEQHTRKGERREGRLQALDALRGLGIEVGVFTLYGGGGYW